MTDIQDATHNIGLVWYIMGGVGIVSALGIWQYDRWILTLHKTD